MSKGLKDRPRLGRGLSSLISVGAPPPEVAAKMPVQGGGAVAVEEAAPPPPFLPSTPNEIPLADIAPNPHQPRKQFSEASLAELAASLRSTGLVQPIVVRKTTDGYQLIAGERRWRAAKLAGLTQIPAVIRDVDGFTQAQMALVENIHREDLNPIDRATAYRALMTQLGLTQAELATRLGEDRSSIANYLRLLDLAPPVREKVAAGFLTLGHAKVLAAISDPAEQERLAKLVVDQGLSVRNLERAIATSATPPKPAQGAPSAHIADVEKSLSRALGMRVQMRAASGKGWGRLVIHYGSLDQFDELLSRLGVKLDEV